jgi:hypothetical protein
MSITTKQLEDKAMCEKFRSDVCAFLAHDEMIAMLDAFLDADGNTDDELFKDASFDFYSKFELLTRAACIADAEAVKIGNQCDDAAEKHGQLMDAPWNLERAA